jgi:hypothetical protein
MKPNPNYQTTDDAELALAETLGVSIALRPDGTRIFGPTLPEVEYPEYSRRRRLREEIPYKALRFANHSSFGQLRPFIDDDTTRDADPRSHKRI